MRGRNVWKSLGEMMLLWVHRKLTRAESTLHVAKAHLHISTLLFAEDVADHQLGSRKPSLNARILASVS